MSKKAVNKKRAIFISITLLAGVMTVLAFKKTLSLALEDTLFSRSEDCYVDCKTPYGEVLGMASGSVKAYSNCNSNCLIFEPNKEQDTYTGIKWQCVEFARRWLFKNKGVVYEDVDIASDMWLGVTYFTRIADSRKIPLMNYVNGSKVPPKVGNLLVYAKAYLNTGHVAIVTDVDLGAGVVKVAEQNFLNQVWLGNYAREIDVVVRDGQFWVLDAYLLGWKHMPQIAEG